jgi:predicted nucleic acid-binding protein
VIAETATRLRYGAGLKPALTFRDLIEHAEAVGRLNVRRSDADVESRAWAVMEQYADRALSFTDCVGAVTARDASADAVFGLDTHFAMLGFALEP